MWWCLPSWVVVLLAALATTFVSACHRLPEFLEHRFKDVDGHQGLIGFQQFVQLNLSAFLWARRLNKSLATRLRESLTEQDSKLVHG
ncbi:hypothetical protein, partial [Burkholderia ubonensis]|uniref:hypothetical protein n=1 Tax=Burkholderia ubonensis TaxID=101571 RepID=UPI001E2E78A2